ncbi:hypothetical protein [Hyphomonas polymorpha]|uniref:hypothetical protein n=1 Tax=Hyphomonas polymorpha TaxID=74319 RepID=UPI000AAB36F1|nr:hypothetical protein [Hyphomonas polymorpha]
MANKRLWRAYQKDDDCFSLRRHIVPRIQISKMADRVRDPETPPFVAFAPHYAEAERFRSAGIRQYSRLK